MYQHQPEDGFTIIQMILVFVLIAVVALTGFATYESINSHPHFSLLPTKIGQDQCPDGNIDVNFAYAQIALGNISCGNSSTSNIIEASYWYGDGVQFNYNGWSCQTFKELGHTEWNSFWDGTYYTYYSTNNNQQIAFNAGTYDGAGPINDFGLLEPDTEGQSQCLPIFSAVGNLTYTQVSVSDASLCSAVPNVVQMAANKLGVKLISGNYFCFVNSFNGDSTTSITTALKNYYV